MSKWRDINTGRGYRIALTIRSSRNLKKDSKVVILCHGLGNTSNNSLIAQLDKKFFEKKYITVRFDFAGHGKSGGQIKEKTVRNFIKDLDSVVSYLIKHFRISDKNIILVGHSIGALTVLVNSGMHVKRYAGVVMIGCNSDANAKYNSLLNSGKIKEYKNYSTVGSTKISKDFWDNRTKYIVKKFVSKIMIPKLFICGIKDTVNPPNESNQLFKWSKGKKKIILIPNANHNFKNSNEVNRTVKAITSWKYE